MRSFLFAVAILTASIGSATAPKIAVYVDGLVEDGVKNIVQSAMTNAVVQDGNFTPLERDEAFIKSKLRESAHQLSGSVAEDEIKKLTEGLGAEYTFSADLSSLYGELYGRTSIFNMVTNEVLASAEHSARVNSISELRSFAETLASRTMDNLPVNKQKRVEEETARRQKQQAEAEHLRKVQEAEEFLSWCDLKPVYSAKDIIDQARYLNGTYSPYRDAQEDEVIKFVRSCKLLNKNQYNYNIFYNLGPPIEEDMGDKQYKVMLHNSNAICPFVEVTKSVIRWYNGCICYSKDKKGNIIYNYSPSNDPCFVLRINRRYKKL